MKHNTAKILDTHRVEDDLDLQSSFFDLQDRHKKLDERDALQPLNELIDWEIFRKPIEKTRRKSRRSKAGRKPFDAVLMFKVLVLQHLYNLSDDELEYQVRDRYSFCRFLGLTPEQRIPDSKTIWLFREQLTKADLIKPLFYRFNEYLESRGYVARKGQMVDASIVDAPKQRNSREENAQIKAGEVPEQFKENPNVGRQKDTEARWTKKNHENRYGYKNHISADVKHKLIRDFDVTPAHVHDSQVFLDILAPNTSKAVWADSAYRSAEIENALAERGYRSQVHRKGTRNKPLSQAQQRTNRRKSSIRVRIEHVFGAQSNEQAAGYIRTIGVSRARCKIGLTNLVYNLRRLVVLDRQVAPAC